MKTVRHELIHCWQFQHSRYDLAQPTKHARAHGPSFERWMPVLNVPKRGENVLGTWTIECPSCHSVIETIIKRRKNQIARFIHSTESVTCQECEKDVSEYVVKRGGEQVDIESLPEMRVPSDSQNSVALSGSSDEQSGSINPEQSSVTRSLTDLTGVGDSIAVTLGGDIHVVEDLVAPDGGFADDVLAAVSAEYHDSLREDVIEWCSTALFHRGEDDPERYDQVVSGLKREQGRSSECSDRGDEIRALCRTLRTAVEPGDTLKLTFEDGEDCTVQVERKSIGNPIIIGVSGRSGGNTVSSDEMIYAPAPSRLEFPVLEAKPKSEDIIWGEELNRPVEKKIVKIKRH